MKIRIFICLIGVFLSFALNAQTPALTLEQKLALARHLADEAAQGKAETGRVLTGDFDFAKELKRCRALGKIPEASQESISEYSDITADSMSEKDSTKSDKKISEEKPSLPKKKYVVDTSKDFINGYYTGLIGGDEKASQARKKDMLETAMLEKKLSQMPNYFSYKGRLFDIISDDYNAHTTMISVLNEFEKVFDAYFSNENNQLLFSKKILFKLSKEKNPKKNTLLSIGDTGDFSLYVAWSKSLRIEEFCDAVATTVLAKIAYDNGGKYAVNKVPLWLKMAMARLLEQSVRFGVSMDMAQIASDNPPPLPLAVFSTSSGTEVTQAHSYWTLVALGKVIKDKSALSSFMRRVVLGNSPKMLVEKIDTFKPNRYDFKLWWRCLITGEIWARMGGVLSPKRSASEIARLAVLQVSTEDGQRVGVSLSKLWEDRDLLSTEIKQRVLEIKVALSIINSVYYNSLISLGRMYEAVENGDKSDFEKSKRDFSTEYQQARAISSQINSMIRN